MCGIAGAFCRRRGDRLDPHDLFGMVDALNHRGPESVGYWVDPEHSVMLMHARMAMVDPEGGGQPMSNETGSVWISLNGEIYDFRRQSRQLMDRGHRFRSRCDVEVVPHLYEDHGIGCLNHLRGEFALALYDARARTLLLARDRFGTKPLFYAEAGGTVVFGSEAKAVLAHPLIEARLDAETLKLLFLGLPLPDRSVFKGLRQVRPGHYLKVTASGLIEEPWWTLRLAPGRFKGSMADAVDEFRARLDEAVKLRLDADVRIGGFLSGGLDSAAVLESVARQYDQKIETFTIRFGDDADDEANAAADAARQLGIENTAIRITGDQLTEEFTRSVWHAEIPLINSAGTAKMLLGMAARERLKAVMTGSGADELFGGYGMYQHQMLIEEARAGKNVAAEMKALRASEDVVASLLPVNGYRRHDQVKAMFGAYPYQAIRPFVFGSIVSRMLHPDHAGGLDPIAALREIAQWLPEGRLEGLSPQSATQYLKVACDLPWYIMTSLDDRPEMAASIEGRTPFLDHQLAEFAFGLPSELLFDRQRGKLVPRAALAGRLPQATVSGQTRLFRTPPRLNDRILTSEESRHYLSGRVTGDVGLFSPRRVALARAALRVVPRSSWQGSGLRTMLMSVLSVHMLNDLYVRRFTESVDRFSSRRRRWNRGDLDRVAPQRPPAAA